MTMRVFAVSYGAWGSAPSRTDIACPLWAAKHGAVRFLRRQAKALRDKGDEQTARRMDSAAERIVESLVGEVLFGLTIKFTDAGGTTRFVTIHEKGTDHRDSQTVIDVDHGADTGWLRSLRGATASHTMTGGYSTASRGERSSTDSAAQRAGEAMARAARKAVESNE